MQRVLAVKNLLVLGEGDGAHVQLTNMYLNAQRKKNACWVRRK